MLFSDTKKSARRYNLLCRQYVFVAAYVVSLLSGVCVCMYVCMYVYMYVYICMYVCVRMYVCMYVCMCVCVCMYICMYIYFFILFIYSMPHYYSNITCLLVRLVYNAIYICNCS